MDAVTFFPPDFFDPILPEQKGIQSKNFDNNKKEDKRVFVDLTKEYEEDKELIELLEGKRKNI